MAEALSQFVKGKKSAAAAEILSFSVKHVAASSPSTVEHLETMVPHVLFSLGDKEKRVRDSSEKDTISKDTEDAIIKRAQEEGLLIKVEDIGNPSIPNGTFLTCILNTFTYLLAQNDGGFVFHANCDW